jgi:putative solute:sodium symporter small subunit
VRERSYWQDNLRLVGVCLVIWFTVSFGFGILLVNVLNRIEIGGFKLGFWFAQQGSIYVFVALIFFYAWRMSIVDARHGSKLGLPADENRSEAPGAPRDGGDV